MIEPERRFFPERRYRLSLKWVLWGAFVVIGLAVFVVIRLFVR